MRDRHAVEAVARAVAVDEAELRTEQLRAAAETGNRAGDNEAGEHKALDGNAVEAAGREVAADGAQAEARARPEQDVIEDQADRDRDHKAPVKRIPVMMRGRCTSSAMAGVCGTEASRIQLV